jgi:regulator of sigma E protease
MSLSLLFLLFNLQKIIHEFGHFVMAKRAGILVEEFGIGYPPRVFELGRREDTIFTANWLLFGSFIKMLGEKDASIPGSYASKSKFIRLSILIVGPILNLVTMCLFLLPAVGFFTFAYMSGIQEPITGINANGQEASIVTTVINEIVAGSPAEKAGLLVGDKIIGANEVRFKYAGDLVAYSEKTKGEEITLHIERGSRALQIPITSRPNPPQGQGALGLGIAYEDAESKTTYYPLPTAFVKGVKSTVEYGWRAIYISVTIFRNSIWAEEPAPLRLSESNLILPPARAELTRWFPIFWFLGVLNSSATFPIVLITAISFLPLPKWDTWRIIALLFEK